VRRHILTDDVHEVVASHIPQELELFAQVLHRGIEIVLGAEVVLEGAVLIDQVYNPAGMADEGLKLSAVADHALVLGQSLDVLVA